MPAERTDLASTERFSDRADAYAAARPGYPPEMVDALRRYAGLPERAVVADLGSGTGLSAEPFLRAGLTVIGVEPNAAMRAAGERHLAGYPGFRSVNGCAEATGLPAASVDLVLAAQAAHWFDAARARAEARRILRAPGWAALIWNDRDATADDFARGYEALVAEFGTDYAAVCHRHAQPELVAAFFGAAQVTELRFPNPTVLDYPTLVLRVASASYMPAAGDPAHAAMSAALEALFARTQSNGHVTFRYTTRVFCAALGTAHGVA